MPQGQAAVTWSAENDVKLFLTVLAVQGIQVDYAAVAKAFGPNVPGSCIQSRMKALRKKANEMGVSPQVSPGSSTAKRPRAPAPGTPAKKPKLKKTQKGVDDQDSDDGKALLVTPTSSDDSGSTEVVKQAMTPPSSAETTKAKKAVRAKSRVSPRKGAKKDYKSLGDPFATMDNVNDSSGENIFGHDKSESEDSAASDGDFGTEAINTEAPTEI